MKLLKLCWLPVLLMAMFLGGCSQSEKAEPESNVAEFCAVATDENTYNLHLVKNIEIPWDSSWEIPAVVHDRCLFWDYDYRLDAPTKCIEGELCRLRGGGGGGICTSTGSARDIEVPSPERRLFLRSEDAVWNLTDFDMYRVRDSLVPYFGKEFEGRWRANLRNEGPKLNATFKAKIVGFCDELPPVAEYCVLRGDSLELRLMDIVDYIEPQSFFNEGRACQGGFRSEKKLELDLGEYGQISKGPFVEELSCKGDVPIHNEVRVSIPRAIALDSVKNFSIGKKINARWIAELSCGSEKVKRVLPFSIKVVGECPEEEGNRQVYGLEEKMRLSCQRYSNCFEGCELDEEDERYMKMLLEDEKRHAEKE